MVAQQVWRLTCDQQLTSLFDSHSGRSCTTSKFLHHCVPVTKQYNLVLVTGRWHSLLGR